MNIVVQEVVDKLQLPMEVHPNSYLITWLNDFSDEEILSGHAYWKSQGLHYSTCTMLF